LVCAKISSQDGVFLLQPTASSETKLNIRIFFIGYLLGADVCSGYARRIRAAFAGLHREVAVTDGSRCQRWQHPHRCPIRR
jgi:hypothetical protein